MSEKGLTRLKNNTLNDIETSGGWVRWLHSTHTYDWTVPKELREHLRLGTLTPPPLAADIIRFFTKRGAQIFDPFAGEGGILVGAAMAGRLAAGADLYTENAEIAAKVGEHYGFPAGCGWWGMQCADAVDWLNWLVEGRDGQLVGTQDLLFTDPPWGIEHGRTQDEGGSVPFNMAAQNERDIGGFATWGEFYQYLGQVSTLSALLLKPKAYALWWLGDRHRGGRYRVVGAEAQPYIESAGFTLKGVQHWVPGKLNVRRQVFGWGKAYVPLVDHQTLWIYRKEG